MNCPRCDSPATGKFCSSCGASLEPSDCPSCGARPEPGDRFCNRCGTFMEAGAAGRGGGTAAGRNIAWWTAGGLLVVLILVLARPLLQGGGRPQPAVAPPGVAAPAGVGASSAVDLASMTPREAADRLFNRVMSAVERGDSVEITNFLPMSIAAYERAQPLDADGVFHLGLLQLTGLQLDEARAVADEALAQQPGHLLLLSVAAEAAKLQGDEAGATAYYQAMVDGWEAQIASGLADYAAHASTVSQIEQDARSFLGDR